MLHSPHLQIVVPDDVVVLVHGGLEQLVAELPLDADAHAAGVLQELVQALLDLQYYEAHLVQCIYSMRQ